MGAADDIVSESKVYIDGPMGNFQLRKCKSIDVDDDSDAEIVTAMGVKQGAGSRYKEGGVSLSLEIFREQGTPEVDWAKHKRLRTRFSITIQDTGGSREQYQNCFVAKVPRKDDDQGSHMMTVKVLALAGPIALPS